MTTTNDLKNHLATQGDNVLGAIVMWTLAGFCVPRDAFRDFMDGLGLGDAVGRDPKPITHARGAIADAGVGQKDVLIRQVTHDETKTVWAIVRETRDVANVEVRHKQESRIALFHATGELAIEDESDAVASKVRERFELRRDHVLTADVSSTVIKALKKELGGLRLAGNGGAYFVRPEHVERMKHLGTWLEDTGAPDTLVTVIEVTGAGDNLTQAGRRAHRELSDKVRSVLAEARDFIAELQARDHGEDVAAVPERVMETRMRRFNDLRESAGLYADILGDLRGKLEQQIEDARREVLGLADPSTVRTDDPDVFEDEDGVDAPFDRAMDRAMADDAAAAPAAPPAPAEDEFAFDAEV